jgi:hypothetical protein
VYLQIIALILIQPPAGRVFRVDSYLDTLAGKLGKQISVQPSLGKKLVFVSNLEAPPAELLAALAIAVHGSLTTVADGVRLDRTVEDLKTLKTAEIKERAFWFQARLDEIAKFRKGISSTPSVSAAVGAELVNERRLTEDFRLHHGPRPLSFFAPQLLPSENLLESLISRIGIDELASIPTGQIRIYEDLPVDGAAQLPAHGDLLDDYMRESVPYEASPLGSDATYAVNELRLASYFAHLGHPTKRPVKLRLKISVRVTDLVLNLEGFDGDGNRVLVANFFTRGRTASRPYPSIATEEMVKPDAKWAGLPESARSGLDSVLKPNAAVGVPSDWLLHPESQEPLNLFVSGALAAFAAQEPSKLMVIDVDDFFWQFVRPCCKDGQICVSALQAELDEAEDYERIETTSSVVLRPRFPEALEAAQADRKVLGRAAQALVEGKGDRLRTLSLLFHEASPEFSTLARAWARMALRFAPNDSEELWGDDAYRLLGAIPEDEWAALQDGDRAAAGRIGVTNEARSLFLSDTQIPFGENPPSDLNHHAIELYAQWPVGQTTISMKPTEVTAVRWLMPDVGSKPAMWSWWQPVGALTAFAPLPIARASNGALSVVGTQDAFEARLGRNWQFQLATEHDRLITLNLPEGFRIEWFDRGAKHDISHPGAYADLPADLRAKVWQDAKELGLRQFMQLLASYRSDERLATPDVIKP